MSKTNDDDIEDIDNAESAEEVLDESGLATDDYDESIPEEDGKPVRKKVAALKARHALEDYFENKKIRHELDYLLDEEEEKNKAQK